MDTIEAILTRNSVRQFKDIEVSDEVIHRILEAGMAGPSAVNARPFQFIVIKDKNTLSKMADGNGRAAEPLRGCAFAVLICGDLNKAYPKAKDYFVIDCSIVGQNMILAAQNLGVGSVWIGTYPQDFKVEAQRRLFDLPLEIVPHSIIAFGYPLEANTKKKEYDDSIVHYGKW